MNAIIKRLKSRTYWLGLGTLLLGILETAQATGVAPDILDGKGRAVVTVGIAVAIFVLRELTKGRISDK